MKHLPSLLLSTVCIIHCILAADEEGGLQDRQKRHAPVRLENFGVLEDIARLDERLDPEYEIFQQLLLPILRPRYVGTQAHEDVREHIVSVLTALGWQVDGNRTFQMRTPVGSMPFTNVVATYDPDAPRRLVVACHYDSIYNRPNFAAATDSAVPCAMMLYLATLVTERYLKPMKGRSEVTLQLMFLDGEEAFVRWTDQDSIYGARKLANELHRTVYTARSARGTEQVSELDRIDLFVLLDLLGAARPEISNYISDTPKEFRHLAAVERKLAKGGMLSPGVAKIFKYKDSWGLWGRPKISDDHLPFMRRGVKILHVIPSPFPSVWHEDSDNASALHYPTIRNLNRILRVFVSEYLNVPVYL